jgi:hypothetical protein
MAASRKPKRPSEPDWTLIHKIAVSLEKGRFNDYVDLLQNTRLLLWKSFVSGVGKGFGAVIGATLVVAIVVGILAMLADVLPGEAGDFFQGTSDTINPANTPG